MTPRHMAWLLVLPLLLAPAALPGPFASAGSPLPSCPAGTANPGGVVVSPPGGSSFEVCSGRVPSFDGTPLDADVSIPLAAAAAPRPLMLFIHGWGNSKTDWESATLEGTRPDTYHWNNAWFASQGYVVLNYTARGFATSCGKAAPSYLYSTDPACSGRASWTHLADRRWEVHDSQYLAGLLVDAGLVQPRRVVVSGGSYGGGQSWELAMSQDQVVDSASTDPAAPILHPWTSPAGIPLHLAAALPMYPWTDLADALVQNGRAADGAHGGPPDGAVGGTHETPIGVEKQTYVDGLFASGVSSAQYAPTGVDPTADLTAWLAALSAGEPYEQNTVARTAVREVGGAFRSPFAMPVPAVAQEVPTFVIQGQTDPLFPAFQAVDMVNRLRAADPAYPVWTFFGDLGHAYALGPASLWRQAHDAGNSWLSSIMAGLSPANPPVTVTTTLCGTGSAGAAYPTQTITGSSYAGLAADVLRFTSAASQVTVHTGGTAPPATPEGQAVDPITSGGGASGTAGCPTIAASRSDPAQAVYVFTPLSSATTLVGAPVVAVDMAIVGQNALVAARLWDLDPASGMQTLITRTVYRITSASPTSASRLLFELWPQAYSFAAGHQVKLELTQDDSPTWRPDNLPARITFSNLVLALPVQGAASVPVPPTGGALGHSDRGDQSGQPSPRCQNQRRRCAAAAGASRVSAS